MSCHPRFAAGAELQHGQLINLDTMLSDLLEISKGLRMRCDGTLHGARRSGAKIVHTVVESQGPSPRPTGFRSHSLPGRCQQPVEPRRVERIIRNLVVNALEHAESEGRFLSA